MSDELKREWLMLSAADGAVLDALLSQRAEGARVRLQEANGAEPTGAEHDAARRGRVQGWLNVLGAAAAPAAPAGLLEKTLGAVEGERMKLRPAASAAPMPVSHSHEQPVRRRWRYLGEVAAMFVAATLLVAVIVPAMGQARQSYRRTLCATNLGSVGTGFGQYAVAYNGELPTLGVPADRNWLSPGAGGHTNTANLIPLVKTEYVPATRLVCAGRGLPEGSAAVVTGRDIEDSSYSYVNLFGPHRPRWDGKGSTLVLADRNPLFYGDGSRNPERNSFNHAQKGTYVLRADGRVTWEVTPNVGPSRDNIWTVGLGTNRVVEYSGTEVPMGAGDVFLAP